MTALSLFRFATALAAETEAPAAARECERLRYTMITTSGASFFQTPSVTFVL